MCSNQLVNHCSDTFSTNAVAPVVGREEAIAETHDVCRHPLMGFASLYPSYAGWPGLSATRTKLALDLHLSPRDPDNSGAQNEQDSSGPSEDFHFQARKSHRRGRRGAGLAGRTD